MNKVKIYLYRFLVKLGIMTPDTKLWVLVWVYRKKENFEWFLSEMEAVNRKQELINKYKSVKLILNSYTGVDTNPKRTPIIATGSLLYPTKKDPS